MSSPPDDSTKDLVAGSHETYDPGERIECSHAECTAEAEVIPVIVLRHKRHKAASNVDIHVPVCRRHLPAFDALVANGGWASLCAWVESQGRKRPRRKFSELAFRRLGVMADAGDELLTPQTIGGIH